MIDGNKGEPVKITCLVSDLMSTELHVYFMSVVEKALQNEKYYFILILFSISPMEKYFK